MAAENLKEIIKRELPALLRSDPALRRFILDLTRETYADRQQTEDRFDRVLDELRRDREEQTRKWEEEKLEREREREEQARKWEEQKLERDRDREEQNRKWEKEKLEREREREEQTRKWEEQKLERDRDREEQTRKWEEQKLERDRDREEQNRKWEEQNRKWDQQQAENREEFQRVHEEIMAQAKKFDRSIGALGARWGMQSEKAFRDALAGILELSFGVQVLNINEYDDQGEVFGRPEQVELDVIIKNGLLLICELKSSIDKAGMYIFERKARFYEKRHQRTADRLIVVSPMIEPKARKVAEKLGIETYSDSLEVGMSGEEPDDALQ